MAAFTVKTAEDVRDDILRVIRAGLIAIGVPNPNVAPGSDEYVRAQGIGNQIEIAMANCQTQADDLMPDSAGEEGLARILAIYGDGFRSAAGAAGSVLLSSTATTAITVGAQLIDGAGLRAQVTLGGTYANGARVPVQFIDTGDATNHEAGDVLRWVTPPPFAAQTAVVATGGITGGHEAETPETARQRLFDRYRYPPLAGNWAHVAALCEQADPLVQKAFVYPAVNGPSNVGVCVVGYPTAVSKSRQVPALNVSGNVKPYLDGLYPEHADTIVTSATDSVFDVALALSLPASQLASPAGPGGGWTDGTPWPRNTAASSSFACRVTAVASSLTFTVDAPSAPTAGITQIAWLSPTDWTVYTATVVSYSGSAGAYAVTLDKPFPNIAVGCFISPNALNVASYFAAVLAHFAAMGPGEKVASNTFNFARGFRHPTPNQAWPYKVAAPMLRAVTNAGSEVAAAEFLYVTTTGAPAVPGSVSLAPAIFIPRHIGLYEKVT